MIAALALTVGVADARADEPAEPAGGETAAEGGAPGEDEATAIEDAGPAAGQSMWTPRRKIALGLAAAGVTAFGVGFGFGASAQAYADAAWEECPTEPCMDAEALAWGDTSHSRATMANTMFVGGSILIVSAVAIWFLGGPQPDEGAQVVPVVSDDAAGAALIGSW